jgi:hypothetical protein
VTTVRSLMRIQTYPRGRPHRRKVSARPLPLGLVGVAPGGWGVGLRSRSQAHSRLFKGVGGFGPTPEDEEIECDGPYSWSGPHRTAPFSGSIGDDPRSGPHLSGPVAEGADGARAGAAYEKLPAGKQPRCLFPPPPRHIFHLSRDAAATAPKTSVSPSALSRSVAPVAGGLFGRLQPLPENTEPKEPVSSLATLAVESQGVNPSHQQRPNPLFSAGSTPSSAPRCTASSPGKADPRNTRLSSLDQASFGSLPPRTISHVETLPAGASDASSDATSDASPKPSADAHPRTPSDPPCKPLASHLSFLSGGGLTDRLSDGATTADSQMHCVTARTPRPQHCTGRPSAAIASCGATDSHTHHHTPQPQHCTGSPVAVTTSYDTAFDSDSDPSTPCVRILSRMVNVPLSDRHRFVPCPETPPHPRPQVPALGSGSLSSAYTSTLQPASVGTHGSCTPSPAKPAGSLLRVIGSSHRRGEHASPVPAVGQTGTLTSSVGGNNSVVDSPGPPSMFLPGPPFRGGWPAKVHTLIIKAE